MSDAHQTHTPEPKELPPPGSRSGKGAQSVLPYLSKQIEAKPRGQGRGEPADAPRPPNEKPTKR